MRIISKELEIKILKNLVKTLFMWHRHAYRAVNINYKKDLHCIYALWHCHQCGLYSLETREKLNVMVSKSKDGDIVACAVEALGMKTVRGSKTRGGTGATLELIDRINKGENGAITIDGPLGPKGVVKKGIIDIAKITGVPIVPMTWYCGERGALVFNSWDKFCYPIPFKKLINIYGEPIYVPKDINDEEKEVLRKKVEDELNSLYAKAKAEYKTLVKTKQP